MVKNRRICGALAERRSRKTPPRGRTCRLKLKEFTDQGQEESRLVKAKNWKNYDRKERKLHRDNGL
jgi:hypothetical protein